MEEWSRTGIGLSGGVDKEEEYKSEKALVPLSFHCCRMTFKAE